MCTNAVGDVLDVDGVEVLVLARLGGWRRREEAGGAGRSREEAGGAAPMASEISTFPFNIHQRPPYLLHEDLGVDVVVVAGGEDVDVPHHLQHVQALVHGGKDGGAAAGGVCVVFVCVWLIIILVVEVVACCWLGG